LTAEACLRHGSGFSHNPIEFHCHKNDAIGRWKLSAPQRNQLKPVRAVESTQHEEPLKGCLAPFPYTEINEGKKSCRATGAVKNRLVPSDSVGPDLRSRFLSQISSSYSLPFEPSRRLGDHLL
jgi:hypothetical protein